MDASSQFTPTEEGEDSGHSAPLQSRRYGYYVDYRVRENDKMVGELTGEGVNRMDSQCSLPTRKEDQEQALRGRDYPAHTCSNRVIPTKVGIQGLL
jgi:hypothetical protein